MKFLIIFSLFISTLAFSSETKTECPWMREMTKRNNPKLHLMGHKIKTNIETKNLTIKQ